MIRLIASDLDGTLVRSDGTVSARTRAAVQRAVDAGFVIAFVTGRPPRWLHEIADATGHSGVAVAANGAVIYDLHTETVVRAHELTPGLMRTLTQELKAAFPRVYFAVEYGLTFAYEPGYRHDWDMSPTRDRHGHPIPPPVQGEVNEIIGRPAVKLLAKDREADPDEFMRSAAVLLAGRATVTHSSRLGLVEIAAAGVTKASGLAEVASAHGISAHEVVAVGDMPNDVPMLQWAGRAYAVANAHTAAIGAADGVLASNDDDGVARLIESLII